MAIDGPVPANSPIALVYLARGVDGGKEMVENFFRAYHDFPPGYSHNLILLSKGWEDPHEFENLKKSYIKTNVRIIELPDDGYDWGAYMRAMPQLNYEWICFLNTHSRPQVRGWLKILKDTADLYGSKFGIVGATASWESTASFRNAKPKDAFRFAWDTLRRIKNLLFFKSYPNPHIRSNAFLVQKATFSNFIKNKKIPKSKFDAMKLESGRYGFSMHLRNLGLDILVAGADGLAYSANDWDQSGVFRNPGQPNLLVKDNQTEAYASSDPARRQFLETLSWGRQFSK